MLQYINDVHVHVYVYIYFVLPIMQSLVISVDELRKKISFLHQ